MTRNGIEFAKRVGIVCGAIIAAGTVVQFVGGFLWGHATRPIMEAIAEERIARQRGELEGARRDSLIVEQIAMIGEAIRFPVGSRASQEAAKEASEVPAIMKREQRSQRR